jgi:hypothetical protein
VVVRGELTTERLNCIAELGRPLQLEDPDFALNVWPEGGLDDHPRVALWTEAGVVAIGTGTVNVRELVWRAFADVPEVVDVTCSPGDSVPRGTQCFVSAVLRCQMKPPPLELLKRVDDIATELRKSMPEIVEMQAAPELNYPPSGVRADDSGDGWLELKAEVMRVVEPYRFVIAAYFRAPDEDHSQPTVYVYGEDAPKLLGELTALDGGILCVHAVMHWRDVPREARCIFNNVTRLIKAQALGETAEVERLRAAIMESDGPRLTPHPCVVCGEPAEAACSVCHAEYSAWLHVCSKPTCRTQHERDERAPGRIREQLAHFAVIEGLNQPRDPQGAPRPRALTFEEKVAGRKPIRSVGPPIPNPRPAVGVGPVRGDPSTHLVHCRWCGEMTPASTNPRYHDVCDACGALQAATTIPTKSQAMPLISVFVNPDKTVFLELVFAPPTPGRFDLSRVWRYTLSADACEEFDQHPMGKKKGFTKRGGA